MPPVSEKEKGYNEAANDIAIALTDLHKHKHFGSECVLVRQLVARFLELRRARFQYELASQT